MRKNKLFLMALLFVSAVVLAGVHQLSPVTGVSGLITQMSGDDTTGDGTTTPDGEGQETPDELYQIAERFTSVAELEGKIFAIVNEADGKVIYNIDNQNLAYDTYAMAMTGNAYLWKINAVSGKSYYTVQAVDVNGGDVTVWGNPALLNSGAVGGFDGCFVLGNGSQQGTDMENGGVWEVEYTEGLGFTLKNVGRDGYFAGVKPAPSGQEPIYWTFCTFKKNEEPEPEPLFSNGAYYLYNVGTRKYMAAGADWGTHAIVNNTGLDYTLTFANGKYTIDSQINHSDEKHFLNGVWNDDVAFGWTFSKIGEGIYTISDGTNFLTAGADGLVTLASDGTAETAQWILKSHLERIKELESATAEAPVDATFLIRCPDFSINDPRWILWTMEASNQNLSGGNNDNRCAESYHSVFTLSQKLADAPIGKYQLTAQGFYRQDNGVVDEAPVFYANGKTVAFPVKEGSENSMADASTSFSAGNYTIEPITFYVSEYGDLTIGAKGTSTNQWVIFDNFHLTYFGTSVDISEFEADYQTALATAQALLVDDAYAVVTGAEKDSLTTNIARYSEVENTQEAYEVAIAALNEAVNTFKKAKAAYEDFEVTKSEAAIYDEMFPYATAEKKAEAQKYLNFTPNTADEAKHYAEIIKMLYRQIAESSAMLESVEGVVDMTSVIVNPNGSEGVNDPWTLVLGEGSEGSIIIRSGQPLCDGNNNYYDPYFDGGNWDAQAWDVALQQSITLPRGKYQLTVSARASSDVALTVFAGDNTQGIPALGDFGGLFGNGWNDASVEFELQEQSKIAIGVRGVTEDIHNWMSFTRFRLVQFNGDPLPDEVETVLTADAWNETDTNGIPEGYYFFSQNGEVRTSDTAYGSGPRMFTFPEGGDFTKGMYVREGYLEYGSVEDYELTLEANKNYTISFNSAMWKDNGQKFLFQILKVNDSESLVFEEEIVNEVNVNGQFDIISGSNKNKFTFTPEESGNYLLRWLSNGFCEILIANPTVTHYPAGMSEEQVEFDEALMNAKYVLNENADLSESSSYKSLAKYIQDVEEANPTTAEDMIQYTELLNGAVQELQEFRSLSKQFSELAILAYYQYQDFAETKFALTGIYERLGLTVTKYIPNGEVPVVNLYSDLVYNVNMFANITNEVSKMFTVGPSTIDENSATHTGVAVLIDRIRQGAETMRALKIDNEQLLTQADNALTDDDDLAENIKQAITNQLKQAGNNLFEAVIDAETGEEVIPVYNMNVFVKNPNLYVKGEVMPGWDVEGTYNYETGWVPRNDDNIPTDGVIMNWAGTFTASQTITDLPAGIYTVKAAVSERSYTYDLTTGESYFFASTGDETLTHGVNYIGQRFPMISNNDEVTIEGVEVVDGTLTLGVQAGEGSHLFFNEVQLLLTAPISEEFVLGDVNLNGEVTTSDAVAAVSIVLEELTPTRSQFLAADVNKSNSITVSDVIGIVNIVLNGDDAGAAGARGDASQNWLTQRATTVGLMNTTEFVGFQMDVTLADGAVLNGVTLNQRAAGLNVKFNRVAGNTYRVVAFSMDKTAIQGHEGELLTLDITGSQEMTLSNIEFTDAAARAYALGLDNTTGIDGIMAGVADAEYYTVNGVKSNTMRKGFNVVRTADGKVHKVFVK